MPLYMSNSLSQSQPFARASILGVRVDRLSQHETLDQIDQLIIRYREGDGHIHCQQVVTVNTEFIMEAQHNTIFRQCINQATIVVADGMGVVWATRFLGTPVPERVTGTDTLVALAQLCADKEYALYLLGAAPGVAEIAGERLKQLAPGLRIVGYFAGSPSPQEEDEIIERIHEAHPDVVCVAYGAPAQELWIRRNLSRLSAAVAMGVGGAYDFLSGRRVRAPRFMQRAGLEWLYRLYHEPWRWRRMLAIPRFILLILIKGRKKE
jgi:N-acetylglucosaminyldiphosphoundecaprenol N-acetyl-beta-D-mannosaminyltransferase